MIPLASRPAPASAQHGASPRRVGGWLAWLCLCWLFHSSAPSAHAELQFDVFFGYDGAVHEAGWFPVAVEVFNDGPAFNAVFELSSGQLGAGNVRQVAIELPTNTRKRFVIPVFGGSGRYSQWNARLLDEKGKVRAEKTNLRGKDLVSQSILLGAVPRTFGGLPSFPQIQARQPELQPLVARMQLELFPDNPIALEGLDALYLNSEKALELRVTQVAAIQAWVHGGGHLIVAVEQPQDVNATPWLRELLPWTPKDVATLHMKNELEDWLRAAQVQPEAEAAAPPMVAPPQPMRIDPRMARRYGMPPQAVRPGAAPLLSPGADPFTKLQPDDAFDQADLLVATGKLLDGRVELALQDAPLILSAARGRGTVTVLTFSPEREPFRSWKNRAWFWAKLLHVPSEWFALSDFNTYGGLSIDGVFGAMLDTKQVRKLPVGWLLLLLIVYLLVIGPVDQYCLKKLNRQMLTWLTFPAYVVLFSLLIYFIGYKLRAGETEWNQLDVVDVLPRGERAELRGRSYVSLYSSSNARYPLASDLPHATFRNEFLAFWSGQESGRAQVEQRGAGFRADVYVPVWLSQLYVSDWWQPADQPLAATVTLQGTNYQLKVENKLDRPLTEARLVVNERVFELGEIGAGQTKSFVFERGKGTQLKTFVQTHGGQFGEAVQQRQHALGDSNRERIGNVPLSATAASFISQLDVSRRTQPRNFITPAGYDLSEIVERGEAVVLAWDAGHSLTAPINRFNPPRTQRNTLLRLAVPVKTL